MDTSAIFARPHFKESKITINACVCTSRTNNTTRAHGNEYAGEKQNRLGLSYVEF